MCRRRNDQTPESRDHEHETIITTIKLIIITTTIKKHELDKAPFTFTIRRKIRTITNIP